MQRTLGVIVNPLAGIGGRVGLKGSDGVETVSAAIVRGAEPRAEAMAVRALRQLYGNELQIVTAAGSMGEVACRTAGIDCSVVYAARGAETTVADTVAAASAMIAAAVDGVLVVGGDGTLRDVFSVVGRSVALIGVPAGVKMYSGVFAASAVQAGRIAARHLGPDGPMPLREAEVLDINEDSLRAGRPDTRLYGCALVPADPAMQTAKFARAADDPDLAALCRVAARELEPDCLHIIGPGSTMAMLIAETGLAGSLLGVDLVADGRLLAADVGEADILDRLDGRPARIHVGVIGGTGCLFGRGNQPISARVIARVGRANIQVLATPAKLASLGPAGFFVDTGDPDVDRMLAGYIRVRTSPGRSMVMRVRA